MIKFELKYTSFALYTFIRYFRGTICTPVAIKQGIALPHALDIL